MLLLCNRRLANPNVEPWRSSQLDEEPEEQRGGAQSDADNVLLESKRRDSEVPAAEADQQELDAECEQQNQDEQLVVGEVLEHVELFVFKLAAVDFVEELQHDEGVEEDGVVPAGLIVPLGVLQSNRGSDSE